MGRDVFIDPFRETHSAILSRRGVEQPACRACEALIKGKMQENLSVACNLPPVRQQ